MADQEDPRVEADQVHAALRARAAGGGLDAHRHSHALRRGQ